jgi:hypothetical protein
MIAIELREFPTPAGMMVEVLQGADIGIGHT